MALFSFQEAASSPCRGSNFPVAQDVHGALAARRFAVEFPAMESSLSAA